MIIIIKKTENEKERKRTQFHNMICEIHIFEKVSLTNVKIQQRDEEEEEEEEEEKTKKLPFIRFFFSRHFLYCKIYV